jgi:organic radical activating enzyme
VSLTLATVTPGEPEVFASIQGEGLSAGRPCAFLRLSRCNLACQWCDTAYTWRFEGDNRPHRDGATFARKANQLVLAEAQVAARILALGQERLVITGGEPLLQSAALARMAALLEGMTIEVETNGTVAPHPDFAPFVAQWNVSPKLSHSGNSADIARVFERMETWSEEPKAWFKFVIQAPEDLAEVIELIERHAIARDRVFLMPEGVDSATVRERSRWLAPLCLANRMRFSDRLHIHLFGDSRGT